MKKLKSELKNEEMALVLLKKLKQSQTVARETVVTGGATLTPAPAATKNSKSDPKGQYSSKQNYDILAASDKLVSISTLFSQFLFREHSRQMIIISFN